MRIEASATPAPRASTTLPLRGCEEIHGSSSCGGTTPPASLRLLHDVPASSRRRASQLASSRSQYGPPWISSQPLSEAKDLEHVDQDLERCRFCHPEPRRRRRTR